MPVSACELGYTPPAAASDRFDDYDSGIPSYPTCMGDSPRWHGAHDLRTHVPRGHGGTCQIGYFASGTGVAQLRAQERRTQQLMSSWTTCGASLLQTVAALAERTVSRRATNSSKPAEALTCSVVFVGDSHTYQAFDAAACNLRDTLRPEQRRKLEVVNPLPKYRGALQELFWRDWGLWPVARAQEAIPLLLNRSSGSAMNGSSRSRQSSQLEHQLPPMAVDLSIAFLPRSGRRSFAVDFADMPKDRPHLIPLHPLLANRSGDLMDERLLALMFHKLGSCTLLLWNEGMHAGRLPPSEVHENYRYVLSSFGRAVAAAATTSMAKGDVTGAVARSPSHGNAPILLAWEVIAQHFRTPTGDGLYEHSSIGLHIGHASPSTRANTTKVSTAELAALARLAHALQMPDNKTCTDTRADVIDWRNAILIEEVKAARRGASSPLQVRLLPFHRYSQPWGATLHRWRSDCSHVCYTPYYYVPLWHEMYAAVLSMLRAAR